MGREKKKGTSGNAKAFISRDKALKKLQLSLQEFRRVCILKGIYPREPRRKFEGSDKTYYLRKDIDFLAHERLIGTIRQQNIHHKKVVKARSKRRIDILRRLALNAPKARLDHLVLERYPNFIDAVRELDDPLCIVALFANLPADHKVGISPDHVTKCQRLLREFHNFVARTSCLRRVFVSIKGYYYQANILGENVTWITPHRFSQILPEDVDYSVMLTFLELYECIMSFVNFRLYTGRNLAYPPKISRQADAKALELPSLLVEKASGTSASTFAIASGNKEDGATTLPADTVKAVEKIAMQTQAEDESDEEDAKDSGEAVEKPAQDSRNADVWNDPDTEKTGIFAGKSIVLGREVPYVELEFCLHAADAVNVTRENDLPEDEKRLEGYTHWIIDRPNIVGDRDMSLEYVQPQYVFDSINAGICLPTALYAPGAPLPPHLSPFVTQEDDGGYRPWFKDIIDRIKAGDTTVVDEAAAVVYAKKSEQEKASNSEDGVKGYYHSGGSKAASSLKRSRGKLQGPQEHLKSSAKPIEPRATSKDEIESYHDGNQEDIDQHLDKDKKDPSDDEDEDEEGKEEEISKAKKDQLDKEGRELATLMLSRKKMRQYQKHRREQSEKAAVREKLLKKRKQLEGVTTEKQISSGKKLRR